ncbi:MAG: nicotinamide-nucleotide amidohydrolase family protein [Clostridia bacterium]
MTASVLTIGDEILIGKIVNTNASYVSKVLNENGIACVSQITCPDNESEIVSSLNILTAKSDLIIVTGGLGVTKDDITKQVVAKYVGVELEVNEEARDNTHKYYSDREIEVCADVDGFYTLPIGATMLKNTVGVAAGFVLNFNKKKIAVFPGPPAELIPMFENEFLPILKSLNGGNIITKYFKIFGLRELEVVEKVRDLMQFEADGIFLTTYCGVCDVALVMRFSSKVAMSLVGDMIFEITQRFSRNLYSFTNEELEQALLGVMESKHSAIAVAESVSGGMIASKLVSVPRMGQHLVESMVTYSDESKVSRLGVLPDTLKTYGAVSENVAREMCLGLLSNHLTQYVISTTGFAGPIGADENEEVGLCYIGIGTPQQIKVFKHNFVGTREIIRQACSKQALFYLLNLIKYNEL